MIKVEELRIGNWIEFEGKFYQIATVYDSGQINLKGFNDGSVDISQLSSIQLTDDILINCGFYIDQITTDEYKMYELKTTTTTYILGDSREFEVTVTANSVDQDTVFNHRAKKDIKWLHVLQNLYFVIEEKELTIEL